MVIVAGRGSEAVVRDLGYSYREVAGGIKFRCVREDAQAALQILKEEGFKAKYDN